jgi:spermidine/putrescine transport system ATP-binding protein
VAGFIGTSNLLSGTADQVSGGTATIRVGDGERVLVPVGSRTHQGGQVEVTVRPEKIRISHEEPASDVSAVRGTVSEVVYLGTYNSYAVNLASGAEFTVFEQNARDSSITAERGESVWLSWQPQHSYAIGS